jgi:ubiquinone/menaquinone biosynthesis C-methylase UbiE
MQKGNWNEWLRAHIEEVLREIGIEANQTVLDFGCGSGAYAIPAAKLVGKACPRAKRRDGKVYALDKSEEALEQLNKEGIGNIETILSSDLKTGLKEQSVDVVLLYDVIHMIEDRATLFTEIHRILKSDGLVSIYPMHVETDELLRQMRDSHFSLAAEKYEGNILNFVKHET